MLSFFYRDSVYGTGTFHYTDIGKIFIEFNGKYTVYIVFVYRIEWAGDQVFMFCSLQVFGVRVAFCRFKRCHDRINALFYVQLSRFSVGQSVVIVDTVCDIAVLLCLQDHGTAFDR